MNKALVPAISTTHKLGQPIAPRLLQVTGHLFASDHLLLVGGVVAIARTPPMCAPHEQPRCFKAALRAEASVASGM